MDEREHAGTKSQGGPPDGQAKPASPLRKVVRILGAILACILLIVALLATMIALQPAEFRVARSVLIAAPASDVFPHINDLRKWETWSPWAKIDPAMTQSYEGATEGVGAVYNWSGNAEVGAGRTTIVESRPDDLVGIKLEFFEPMAGTSDVTFALKPEGSSTIVTWTIQGENNFAGKAVSLVMDMDQMIGEQFDKGLAGLKSVVESQQK